VRGRQRLAGGRVRDPGCGLDPATAPVGHDDCAGNSRFDDGFEEMLRFCHRVA